MWFSQMSFTYLRYILEIFKHIVDYQKVAEIKGILFEISQKKKF